MSGQTGSKDEKTWALFCHIGALAGFVFPFGHIIAPLVIWLVKKEELPLVDDQGKESLNFEISMTIYVLAAGLLSLVLIGIPILIALGIFWLVEIIIAAIRANEGQRFRYPLNLRLIK
ncbi:MAG: DUF4870 domain-containing protein [candidate division KSB1 bacterium]|nr:DUF4870 domain-containing protein [candidate division KSB1 bacterium]MDZ7414317.1 DUF4870 domain-containing protein [candidate division KSB1 bacterium]